MSTEQNRVMVEDALCADCAVHVKRVYHRDYPELKAECGTVAEAVAHLAGMLARDREGARTGWQREAIDIAIADVHTYHAALDMAAREQGAGCRCGPRASTHRERTIAGHG